MLRAKDSKFIEDLTPEGRKVMEQTAKKVEEKAQIDNLLYEQMEQADLARKYNRKTIQPEIVSEMIGEKPKLSEEERRKQAALEVKEKWKKQPFLQTREIKGNSER